MDITEQQFHKTMVQETRYQIPFFVVLKPSILKAKSALMSS